jgi:hypothetical protein
MGDKPAMGRLKEEIVVRDYVIWETDAATTTFADIMRRVKGGAK